MRKFIITTGGVLFLILLLAALVGDGGQTLHVAKDPLDPMVQTLQSIAGDRIRLDEPYDLPHTLPGLGGMAVVFETQARPYLNAANLRYVPICSASIVIVVRRGAMPLPIDGWHALLESGAVVCIPHYASESGRLAAIAMAIGLGAEPGDIGPGLAAIKRLKGEGRLVNRNLYSNHITSKSAFQSLEMADAALLWEHQARALCSMQDGWDIITPREGTLRVNIGLLYSSNLTAAELVAAHDFLLSEDGKRFYLSSGFSDPTTHNDLDVWDNARFAYKAAFRREVLRERRNGAATVLERVLLNITGMLLFSIVGLITLRRIPPGIYRKVSLAAMLLVLFWLVVGIIKNMSGDFTFSRYLWLLTYLPRHGLPLCWYCICRIGRYGELPKGRALAAHGFMAALLTMLAITNDLHKQFFLYPLEDPVSWSDLYQYNWGYFLSLAWSLLLISLGVYHLIRARRTRQQRRQVLYAMVLFLALLAYQLLYVAGVRFVIELDISVTVAFALLLFISAAQSERFMGAALLSIPLIRSSPYAISVVDLSGKLVYQNDAMAELAADAPWLDSLLSKPRPDPSRVSACGREFTIHMYALANCCAVVLEDVTGLERVRQKLKAAASKLEAAQQLLIRRQEASGLSARLKEQRNYADQMNRLFLGKVDGVRSILEQIDLMSAETAAGALRQARFHVYLCHRRLRFLIGALEHGQRVSVRLVSQYNQSALADAMRFGVEGVATAPDDGDYGPDIVAALMECVDAMLSRAIALVLASVLIRLDGDGRSAVLSIFLSLQNKLLSADDFTLPDRLYDMSRACGGVLTLQQEEEGVLARLRFAPAGGDA